ncbi:MAG TPA: protease pro-enzyme activation domain-containing protein [Jatrophihabitantaceae bacterium]|nr:protease pro-enzyme activation domain-containing protein [Jatrophihabitantaceae bacterium]
MAALPSPSGAAGSTSSRPPNHYVRIGTSPALPRGARDVSPAASARPVHGAIALQPRDSAKLAADAHAVSDPHSPQYRHYLAPHQFAALYGPTATTVNAVQRTLRAAHLHVGSVSDNGLLMHFRGTAGTVASAFHTRLQTYRLADGATGIRTSSAPALPSSIAAHVTAITGLNRSFRLQPMYRRVTHQQQRTGPAPKVPHFAGEAKPCQAAAQTAKLENGLTLDRIAHAYGLDPLYKSGDLGQGTTIGIFELAPFVRSDVRTFDTCYFGKSVATAMSGRLHNINIDGGSGTGFAPGGTAEADLDVEFASALAPKATIDVYSGNPGDTNDGFVDTYNAIVTADVAKVVSVSYGSCEQNFQEILAAGALNVENQIFEQAALQGQTFVAASGDSGADTCSPNGSGAPTQPYLSVADPSSQPFVMSVGGTAITDAVKGPVEHVWNNGAFGGAAGGGVSSIWGAPSWQQGASNSTDQAALARAYADGAPKCLDAVNGGVCRQLPDVSAEGDPNTGAPAMFDANDGGWFDIGGTSVSAPLWAAMLDLVNGSAGCQATSPVGFAPPALYKAAATASDYATDFSDVQTGNNDMFDLNNGRDFAAGPGYDMGSGLGSPHLAALADNMCAQSGAASRPVITSLQPTTENVGAEVPFTIHGTNLSGVTALSIGTYDVPATGWTVNNDTTITVTSPPASAQTGGQGPQDGSGRAIVSVTNGNGATSPQTSQSALYYLDATSGNNVPSVSAASPYGGPLAGGNTTDVYGSGFTTSGPDAITSVTFGGVAASTYSVVNETDLRVVVPAYASGTTQCAPGNDPVHDICQVQVVVSNANGASATLPILKPDEADSGSCATGCEDHAAPTEYEYFPTPTITSIAPRYLSENGDSIAVLTGHGFDPLGLQWVNVGVPGPALNQDFFIDTSTISSSQMTIQVIPSARLTVKAQPVPITVNSMGGLSAPKQAVYAGGPRLIRVSPNAGPATGGTHISLHGEGFRGTEPENGGAILYEAGFSGTVQLSGYTVSPDGTTITATTPAVSAGLASVLACTVTDCSFPRTDKQFNDTSFDFFEAGDPAVTSVSSHSGPASGGGRVTISGRNLADVVAVKFGSRHSPQFSNAIFSTDRYHLTAVVPPGVAGKRVDIRVITAESQHGGAPSPVTSADRYTYKASPPSPPRNVQVSKQRTSVKVSWSKPLSNGGSRVTGYRVIARALPTHKGKAPKPAAANTKRRSLTLTGLVGGWTYRIVVRARNKHGLGPAGSTGKLYPIVGAR